MCFIYCVVLHVLCIMINQRNLGICMTENSTPQSLTPIWAVFSCVGLCDSNLIILTGKWMSANSLFYSPIVQTAGIPTYDADRLWRWRRGTCWSFVLRWGQMREGHPVKEGGSWRRRRRRKERGKMFWGSLTTSSTPPYVPSLLAWNTKVLWWTHKEENDMNENRLVFTRRYPPLPTVMWVWPT